MRRNSPKTQRIGTHSLCSTMVVLLGVLYAFGGDTQHVKPQASQTVRKTTPTQVPSAIKPSKDNTPVQVGNPFVQGHIAYIDPTTGKLAAPPPDFRLRPDLMTPQMQNSLSTSTQGLIEEPVTVPAGGFKVNLRGRFNSASFARVRADGQVITECSSPLSKATHNHEGKLGVPQENPLRRHE